jgi:hypothetical protein
MAIGASTGARWGHAPGSGIVGARPGPGRQSVDVTGCTCYMGVAISPLCHSGHVAAGPLSWPANAHVDGEWLGMSLADMASYTAEGVFY